MKWGFELEAEFISIYSKVTHSGFELKAGFMSIYSKLTYLFTVANVFWDIGEPHFFSSRILSFHTKERRRHWQHLKIPVMHKYISRSRPFISLCWSPMCLFTLVASWIVHSIVPATSTYFAAAADPEFAYNHGVLGCNCKVVDSSPVNGREAPQHWLQVKWTLWTKWTPQDNFSI